MESHAEGLQLRSLVKPSGELELSLVMVPTPEPAADEVVVRVEASPINPSDLGLLVGAADMSAMQAAGTAERPVVTAPIPAGLMRAMTARVDESMPVGNEGGGVVVAAGSSPQAQALLGKVVGALGGAMYSQYRTLHVSQCLVVADGTTPAEAASCFVNPLTALGMVETMRREGHKALVHTAALVNIVRSEEQASILRGIGAKYICDSTSPTFMDDLVKALAETGATLAFDAIGGGNLAGQILTAMEAAANMTAARYSRYGSTVHKQVYIDGSLNTAPTVLNRSFGLAWGIGGWLLTPFLQKIGAADAQKLRDRVAAELKTTFASQYTKVISLAEALNPEVITAYNRRATGEKFLINPHR
jgi:NADPH:quinone reductase-like Zn-dependent oxidoreductase